MATFTKIIRILDRKDFELLTRKMPCIDHYKFILDLNSELQAKLPSKLNEYITDRRLERTALSIFSQISIRGLNHANHFRIDTCESEHIVKSLDKKSDPIIQILKEHLNLEVFNNLSALICVKTLLTPPSSLFTIKLCLSC